MTQANDTPAGGAAASRRSERLERETRAMRVLYPGRKVNVVADVDVTVFPAGVAHVEEFRRELMVFGAMSGAAKEAGKEVSAVEFFARLGPGAAEAAMRLIDACVTWGSIQGTLPADLTVRLLPPAVFERVLQAWIQENAEGESADPLLVAVPLMLNPLKSSGRSGAATPTSETPSPSSSPPASPPASSSTTSSPGSPTPA